MIDTNRLNYLMKEAGHNNEDCAAILGISTNSFINKKTNKTEFKFSEIVKLAEFIGIKMEDHVFFGTAVESKES